MDNREKLLANSIFGKVVDADLAACYRKAYFEEMGIEADGPASQESWDRVRKFLGLS